jgi:DNA repair protein RadC
MRVKDLAERDRPRERLLTTGHEALADRELLALLIGSGTPGTDAITLAVKVIETCGDLSRLAQAEPHELLTIPGMGPAKAARVAAAFQLARRAESSIPPRQVRGSADLADIAAPLLRRHRTERVVVIVCDPAGNVLRTVRLTDGGTRQKPDPGPRRPPDRALGGWHGLRSGAQSPKREYRAEPGRPARDRTTHHGGGRRRTPLP